ncbi:MAG: hydrogenase maturation protease [Acidobacteriaceae bacterium]
MTATILVAGVGNIFLGDDAFGVEVARSLTRRQLPESVSVKDFGIRGFDLAYALLDPWDAVIIVDALPRGEAPGTLYTVEPNLAGLGNPASPDMAMNPHGMDPVRVLNLAASMGSISARVLIVGCEPKDFGDELEGRMGLSSPVQAAVEEAATMVEELAGRVLRTKNVRPVQLETIER